MSNDFSRSPGRPPSNLASRHFPSQMVNASLRQPEERVRVQPTFSTPVEEPAKPLPPFHRHPSTLYEPQIAKSPSEPTKPFRYQSKSQRPDEAPPSTPGEAKFGIWIKNAPDNKEESPKYSGMWKDGKKHGRGKLVWPSGNVYEGEFHNDFPHGAGRKVYFTGEIYEGEFVKGQKHGLGKTEFIDGSVHQGQYANDTMWGPGVWKYADGSRYEGELKGVLKHGKGVLTSARGSRYEGPFVNDLKEGWGVKTWPHGRRYEGMWKADKFEGYGNLSDPKQAMDSGVFNGNFKNGLKVEGTFQNSRTGEMFQETYKKGLVVASKKLPSNAGLSAFEPNITPIPDPLEQTSPEARAKAVEEMKKRIARLNGEQAEIDKRVVSPWSSQDAFKPSATPDIHCRKAPPPRMQLSPTAAGNRAKRGILAPDSAGDLPIASISADDVVRSGFGDPTTPTPRSGNPLVDSVGRAEKSLRGNRQYQALVSEPSTRTKHTTAYERPTTSDKNMWERMGVMDMPSLSNGHFITSGTHSADVSGVDISTKLKHSSLNG